MELLLEREYEVFGMIRHASTSNTTRIDHLMNEIEVVVGDISDPCSVSRIIEDVQPHETYNFAAMSFVKESWDQPGASIDVTGKGALHLLEALRASRMPQARFYQAGSSEMFGDGMKSHGEAQSEKTPFSPISPYACAKTYAHHIVQTYRKSYKMFAVSGILFNHESPRRGIEFVTQKIATNVALIEKDRTHCFDLGNIKAMRDWGHAKDYVKAMWMMLQHTEPIDYVVGTGSTYSVEDFLQSALACLGLEKYMGNVGFAAQHIRPAEVPILRADSRRIQDELGWSAKVDFHDLVEEMVKAAVTRISGEIKDAYCAN